MCRPYPAILSLTGQNSGRNLDCFRKLTVTLHRKRRAETYRAAARASELGSLYEHIFIVEPCEPSLQEVPNFPKILDPESLSNSIINMQPKTS